MTTATAFHPAHRTTPDQNGGASRPQSTAPLVLGQLAGLSDEQLAETFRFNESVAALAERESATPDVADVVASVIDAAAEADIVAAVQAAKDAAVGHRLAVARDRLLLRQARGRLLKDALPVLEAAVSTARETYQKTATATEKKLSSAGNGLHDQQAWPVNPGAARRQLDFAVRQCGPVRDAMARLQDAKNQLATARQWLGDNARAEAQERAVLERLVRQMIT